MSEDTKQIIRDYLVRTHLDGDSRDFDNETNLLENRILDSFSVLELITFLNATFSVQIRPEQLVPENLQSVNRLADLVERGKGPNQT